MWLVLTDIARYVGVLPATARQLLRQVKLDALE
jgi:hypothetical protein